jgi:RNA polymerase sigma factor (sigma-70 family)
VKSKAQETIEVSEYVLGEAHSVFRRKLYRRGFPRYFVENDAEDAFAQAGLELSIVLGRGERVFNPSGWLINCAWHRAVNRTVREKRSPTVLVPDDQLERAGDERPGVVDEILQDEQAAAVRLAIRQLTEQEQTVVRLLFYEELSIRGAAKKLGWTPSRVQRRKESAERKLSRLISRELESR